MSGADSDDDRPDELTERYRAASAADPARPSDAVGESILAYARTIAADQAARGMASTRRRRSAANDSSWRISAAASVIVAGFATLLAWHLHSPTPVPSQARNPSASDVAAYNPPPTASTGSNQPAESAAREPRASAPPAPNAVTTRPRQRPGAPADTPSAAHDAAADREIGDGSVASSRAAPPGIAGGTVAGNATPSGSAMDAEKGLENRMGTTQGAPSAATAPPNVQALRSQALAAPASPRTSVTPDSPLVTAAESGSLELVDQLLRSGISTEQTDARGRTALLIATLRGDTAMVRRLLAAGAHADAVDDGGDTPLAAARRQGPPELVGLLERASHP